MKTEPTEAGDMLYKFAEMREWNKNKLIGWSEAADFADWFVNQSAPNIKQLEWDDYDGVYFDSISAVGHYIVFDGDKFSEASYRFALSYNGNLVDYFESLDEAKAVAQEHFEKKVKKCLE